jgi:hypothetical protein
VRRTALFLMLALGIVGCRTVWVHPDASAQKYADDMFWCQYGYHRGDEIAEHTAPRPLHRGWRECMGALGWEPRRGVKWELPYDRHDTEAARTMAEAPPVAAQPEKASEYETATWVGEEPRPSAALYERDAALCRGESWDPNEIAQLGQLRRDTGLVLSKSTRAKYAACMAKKNWVHLN